MIHIAIFRAHASGIEVIHKIGRHFCCVSFLHVLSLCIPYIKGWDQSRLRTRNRTHANLIDTTRIILLLLLPLFITYFRSSDIYQRTHAITGTGFLCCTLTRLLIPSSFSRKLHLSDPSLASLPLYHFLGFFNYSPVLSTARHIRMHVINLIRTISIETRTLSSPFDSSSKSLSPSVLVCNSFASIARPRSDA